VGRRGAAGRALGGALTIVCAVFAACAPAGASGAQWEVTQLSEQPRLYGMSCPTPTMCVGTGSSGTLISSTDPTGGPGAWSLVRPGPESLPPGVPVAEYSGSQVRGVSCPTTEFCVAASLNGYLYVSRSPAGPASAWDIADVSPKGANTHMYGISCPAPSLCVAVATEGKIVTSTNPSGGGSAWQTTQLPEPLQLSGVSCPSLSLCVAVGRDGTIAGSTDPTGGAQAWHVAAQPAFGLLYGVSCPTPALCVTANATDVYTSTAPTGDASAWSDTPGVTPLQMTALSCPAPSACAAVNNNADVFTSLDPTGGPAAWSFVNAIPYTAANGVFGISCPNESFCAMAAAEGRVAISTDPFGDAGAPAKPGRGRHHRRPTVKLTGHPRRRVLTGKRRARVRFRFREIGVRTGFLCQLGRTKYRRCRSPKSYSVGPGPHTFRVKAFDPGGFDQTVTRFRFRVVRVHAHGVSRVAG
jgi:hypothetical protein